MERKTSPNLGHSQGRSKREAYSETGLAQDARDTSNQHGYPRKLKNEIDQLKKIIETKSDSLKT